MTPIGVPSACRAINVEAISPPPATSAARTLMSVLFLARKRRDAGRLHEPRAELRRLLETIALFVDSKEARCLPLRHLPLP